MKRVLILANGIPPSRETAQLLIAHHELLIAVDGAIYAAEPLGLTPDIITGDFDSVRLEAICATYPKLRVVRTPDQDKSDLEKAVDAAFDMGATEITVIGASGGRMDHTLGNSAILLTARIPICLADDFGTVQVVRNDGKVDAVLLQGTFAGDTISLITFDRDTSVSIEGVHWPLTEYHLLPGTRGVSNVAIGATVKITVHRGFVFACHLYEARIRLHSEIPSTADPLT